MLASWCVRIESAEGPISWLLETLEIQLMATASNDRPPSRVPPSRAPALWDSSHVAGTVLFVHSGPRYLHEEVWVHACLDYIYHVDLLKHIFSCDMINNQPCLLFIAQVFELHLVHSSGMPGGGSWFSSKWRDYLVAGQRMHHITCQRLEQLPSCENPSICCLT